ncbi:hypothetical protein Tco_0009470 [Tanacetum coccineum]
MNRQFLDSHGPIPGMTPTQALMVIQTMADHSQKWHDGTSSRTMSSSSDIDGLAAVISKLDNLGRDMKKLKENVHAIQVRCQISEGPHLDKECPLNEEVKQVDEVKYGEFGHPAPFNGSSGANFHNQKGFVNEYVKSRWDERSPLMCTPPHSRAPRNRAMFGESDGGGGEFGGEVGGGEGTLGGGDCSFGNGSSSGCHGGLWWLIENEKMQVGLTLEEKIIILFRRSGNVILLVIKRVSALKLKNLMNFFRSKEVGMIWSFSFLGVCKSTKIPFVCEYGLTSEWDYEDLTKLLERKSDKLILNHEGDKNDAGVILLKSDLTIKSRMNDGQLAH